MADKESELLYYISADTRRLRRGIVVRRARHALYIEIRLPNYDAIYHIYISVDLLIYSSGEIE